MEVPAFRHSASVTSASPLPDLVEPTLPLDVESIHDDYADFVWRTLQRLGVRSQDLEDQLQEVFVVVHRRLVTFDSSARVTTWLFGICLRVAAAHRRRAHFRREELTHEPEQQAPPDASGDPERAILRREAAAQLERALGELKLERRAVFVMFEIEGLSAGSIAEMLGIPVGTVHSRLSTARAEFNRAVVRLDRRDSQAGLP